MSTRNIRNYAKVVVDLPTRALSEPFDYAVPRELVADVEVGVPVLVPLGSTKAVGYVVALSDTTDITELRPIDRVLGERLFDEGAIELALWVAQEYLAPLSESLRLFLPPGGSPRLVRGYCAVGQRPHRDVTTVFDLAAREGGVADAELGRPGSANRRIASQLVSAGLLQRTYRLEPPRVSAVTERFSELTTDAAAYMPTRGASMQRALIAALANGPVSVAELRAELGSVDGALRRLSELGVVNLVDRQRLRLPAGRTRHAHRHELLSAGQQEALAAIHDACSGGGGVVLVDGVTGSGKTEVYLRSIEEVLGNGGRAIVLVPEISLTPQTVGRFRSRFGDRVAVLHSRLSAGERYDQWRLALEGEVDVVVGARSALFAPLPNVRLIVIDEEHEPSYKQSNTPRYHAREVAARLCATRGATLVLGSATPSMEAQAAAERGAYRRVALDERVGGGALPSVTVVDMGAEFSDGHRSMFSRPLIDRLRATIEAHEKAILFLNRRGYASFLLCRECGFVPHCDSCAVSLTYHEQGNVLMCHHCGARTPVPPVCPRCSSAFLRRFGAGTQRVEEELGSEFPEVAVVRMDADTTTGKGGHERALMEFEGLDSGILLGTQMVAKGLDYPEVTLVGVINADTTMHIPDFRSAERTFQLLEQVAGRAGRGERPGQVVIQTYWPDHPAVRAVEQRDPDLLYAEERTARSALHYPPYGRLVNIVVTARSLADTRSVAAQVADATSAVVPDGWEVLGPAPAPIAKLKDRHRWHVLVKAPADAATSTVIAQALDAVSAPDGVTIVVDIDPVELV
ncbi:MAG: primosomal protein N' [Coriobacteriia bacterium]|nr:primosomal protein N' [Coriobacteriia bacterium]